MNIKKQSIIVGAVALFMACAVCSCATAVATNQVKTAARSTATPRPTATFTATPNPNPADKVQAYRSVASSDSNALAADLHSVSSDCGGGTSLSACKNDLQTVIDDSKSFQNDLNNNPAPPCLQSTDASLRSALKLLIDGSQSMIKGINNYNVTEVDNGTAQYKQATDYLNQTSTQAAQASC